MQGLIVINGYPKEGKFIRQGERIAKELRSLGVGAEVVKNGEFQAVLRADGGAKLSLGEKYAFAVYLDKDKYLGRAMEAAGLRLFNSAAAVELCDDKLSTYFALQSAGVRLIDSIPAPLCYTPAAKPNEKFLKAVAETLSFPLVAKKSYGSFGEGVQRIPGYAELLAIEEKWLRIPHFYQRYLAESAGRDIRVLVIGGKAVAAMERVAKRGEFRSNIELGGEGRKIWLAEEEKLTAERAARALSLDYCGVDLLPTKEGAAVCEVNSNAFFEGIERVTGENIARLYAEYIFQTLSQREKV